MRVGAISDELAFDSRWPAHTEGVRPNALEGFTVERCLLDSDVTKTVVLLGRYSAQSFNSCTCWYRCSYILSGHSVRFYVSKNNSKCCYCGVSGIVHVLE